MERRSEKREARSEKEGSRMAEIVENQVKRSVRARSEAMQPVPLERVTPSPLIRAVFWGLRVYILAMVVAVIIGFMRGAR